MNTKISIETLLAEMGKLQLAVEQLTAENASLKFQLAIYKNKKKTVATPTHLHPRMKTDQKGIKV